MPVRKNKARGRSGITAGILQLLDSETVKQWLLPLLNACLLNEVMPGSAKLFAIWAIEKFTGRGYHQVHWQTQHPAHRPT